MTRVGLICRNCPIGPCASFFAISGKKPGKMADVQARRNGGSRRVVALDRLWRANRGARGAVYRLAGLCPAGTFMRNGGAGD